MSKRFGLILVALLVMPMLLSACASESRDVAEDFVKAMLEGDADKAQDLACEPYQAAAATLAGEFGALDINNIDLKYDIGKGGNEEEIIVTGSYDIGEGDDADEVELANAIRASEEDDEMIDSRLVLDMAQDGDDWCVEQVNQGGAALGGAADSGEATEEEAETEEEPAATEEATEEVPAEEATEEASS